MLFKKYEKYKTCKYILKFQANKTAWKKISKLLMQKQLEIILKFLKNM